MRRQLNPNQETKVLKFIQLYKGFEKQAMNTIFEQEAAKETVKIKNTTIVKNMLSKKRYALKEIAEIAEVPMAFIKSVKAQMNL